MNQLNALSNRVEYDAYRYKPMQTVGMEMKSVADPAM
jgi:hypothetical protein